MHISNNYPQNSKSKFQLSGSLIVNSNTKDQYTFNLDNLISEAKKKMIEEKQSKKHKGINYLYSSHKPRNNFDYDLYNKDNKNDNEKLDRKDNQLSINNNDINLNARIREIRKNMERARNNRALERKINNQIAFDKDNVDVVFESYKLLNDYRKNKNNQLTEEENILSTFITQNKEISIKNLMIKILKNESNKLNSMQENREKEIADNEINIKNDEKSFNAYSNLQKKSCKSIETALAQLLSKHRRLAEEVKIYKSEVKVTEDEMKKYLELIDNLRICGKFVTKVLGQKEGLFPSFKSPDPLEDNDEDLEMITQDVIEKYKGFIERNDRANRSRLQSIETKQKGKISNRNLMISSNSNNNNNIGFQSINSINSNNSNTNNINVNNNSSINSKNNTKYSKETNSGFRSGASESSPTSYLNDPEIMFRKFSSQENKILALLNVKETTDNEIIKINEEGEAALKDLKERKLIHTKEYESLLKDLEFEKENISTLEYSDNGHSLKDYEFFIREINNTLNGIENLFGIKEPNVNIKYKVHKEINDILKENIQKLEKGEQKIAELMTQMENYEREDKALFEEITNKRKNENKENKQLQSKKNMEQNQLMRKMKTEERFQRVVLKSRKTEAPYQKVKKLKVIKEDPALIKKLEDEEIINY